MLTESTGISVGLILLMLMSFASAVWWAATINTKISQILDAVQRMNLVSEEMQEDIEDLDKRVQNLEMRRSDKCQMN